MLLHERSEIFFKVLTRTKYSRSSLLNVVWNYKEIIIIITVVIII